MRSANQGPIPSELSDLIDKLKDYEERLRKLEAPSGEALSSTVAKLSALVANIQAQLDAWTLSRYTNAAVDAKDAVVNANIATTIASTLAGSVTIGGALYNPPAYSTDLTGVRRTAWWQIDGRAGYASSSREKKAAIRPADETAMLSILDVEAKTFYYRQEIRRRTSRRINEGDDYTPPRETAWIAEELEELGLSWLVYHDENGKPEGIEYSMAVVALLAVNRDHERRIRDLERPAG